MAIFVCNAQISPKPAIAQINDKKQQLVVLTRLSAKRAFGTDLVTRGCRRSGFLAEPRRSHSRPNDGPTNWQRRRSFEPPPGTTPVVPGNRIVRGGFFIAVRSTEQADVASRLTKQTWAAAQGLSDSTVAGQPEINR